MHVAQVLSVVAVGAVSWCCSLPHCVSMVQTRFCAPLPFAHAVVSYSLALHVLHESQMRSCEPLPFAHCVLANSPFPHVAHGTHTRSVVGEGGVCARCPLPHVVTGKQTLPFE